jgi:hypothetical protein
MLGTDAGWRTATFYGTNPADPRLGDRCAREVAPSERVADSVD